METTLKSLYIPETAEVVEVSPLTEQEKLFRLKMRKGQPLNHNPGQFVEISLFGIGEAPISISSSPTQKDYFELCIRRVGSLTQILHRLVPGAEVGIRGPYGKGFPVEAMKGCDILFVAGGLGLAPLRSLIRYTLDNQGDFGRLIILYGGKTPAELLYREELAAWSKIAGVEVLVTVDRPDESWRGNVGVITTLIPKVTLNTSRTYAAVVGPPVMYKYVIADLLIRGFSEDRIVASLERRMKCGLGKCGHCLINGVYVCQDGPTFTYRRIKELPEAI